MIRDFNRLGDGPFDLLVIGGGIYGAWTAYDASLRGLKTALIEKGDWASGTSSASSKLIHGGLRYLEHMKFGLVKKALHERRLLARLGPHRVLPLTFGVPLFKGSRVGPRQMQLGLILYDWLGGAGQPVPPHEFFRGRTFTRKFSFLDERNIRAGFTYGDCLSDDARFVIEIVDGAQKAGAVAVNYACAEKLLLEKGAACGAVVADAVSGAKVEVKARLTVNAAGPWNEPLVPDQSPGTMTRLTKGVHLMMPPLPTSHAFLIITEGDNRIFFLIPWYGKTLLGTTDTDFSGDPDKVRVEKADVDYLLGECNRVFHDIRWKRADILGAFAGLRSLRHVEGANPSDVTREWSLETPMEGMLMPVGGKYTSARADAALIVDKVCEDLSFLAREKRPTEDRAFPWRPPGNFPEWREEMFLACRGLGLEEITAEWACFRYGKRIEKLLEIIRRKPALAKPIVKGLPFCRAEIVLTATEEMSLHLEDVIRRRIPLILLHPARASFVRKLADEVGRCLEWSMERKTAEVEALMACRQAAWLFPE